ncbi:hypothetical protein [Flavobacterium capsici]|uniref:Uncharacterized protein n=1 Tax=Flavobacterium capsici TaxID=3075618 RepID=A0AA96J8Q2_9FLAO|nr:MULTISPECIES: hypothetical protein [unclassified Flavobacterium]WNM18600.1 hypothetical protein RN608_11340 [Flavobacterium sp. PMR2A8]WNM22651.1 hypothetical protein RN605_04640 [Flavobacterium sp. PMTSA4]
MEILNSFCTEYLNLFTIISSIATAIAVGIGLYTLVEVRKQRESTYKPQLIIEEFSFGLDTINYPYKIHFYDSNKILGIPTEPSNKINLNCLNIGFATASNVKFKFGCDIEKYVKIIKKFNNEFVANGNPNNFDIIKLSYSKNQNLILGESIKYPSEIYLNHTEYGNNLKFDYFLPVTIDSNPIRIEIPYFILYLFKVLFYYSLNSKFKVKTNFSFYLETTYLDIANKRHFKKFNFNINPVFNGSKIFKFNVDID